MPLTDLFRSFLIDSKPPVLQEQTFLLIPPQQPVLPAEPTIRRALHLPQEPISNPPRDLVLATLERLIKP